jgi:EAL domain-containing protein (putative c-di-GMP-specific phosphodiesterase class I)/GGDEF domain-containing protein
MAAENPGRVLLLIGSQGNRQRLAEHLQQEYDVVLPEGEAFPQEPFDLALVDPAGFRRWHRELAEAKRQEQPVFLPVMLVISRRHLTHSLHGYWEVIDEFLIAPIDRTELTQRTAMLLRARRLALVQRSYLAYLVNHDRTTGLPNKILFIDRLSRAVHDATVLGQRVYVVVVRIALAPILKSLGAQGLEHAAAACSERLRALVGDEFSLARLTTEEWGLLLRTGASVDRVLSLCDQIRALARTPVEVDGERVHLALRTGIASCPDDAPHAKPLLDCAMAALSEPAERPDIPVFYSRNVQQQALRRIRMQTRLHEALQGNQFELWLQPKLRLCDRQPVGAEALVRWRLPTGELVPPGDFVGVAEATGLIAQIDRWVLERTCAALQSARLESESLPPISVNISAQHLQMKDFVPVVVGTLAHYNVPPSAIELELTETAMVELNIENLSKLSELREQGLRIALDDFGTGYCSLSYLHRLPITTLKVDRAFVTDIAQNHVNAAITQAIVSLAKSFNVEVVAEGIETEAEARHLISLGVHTGQGFLFARPMPEQDFWHWMEAHSRRRGRS